MGGLAHQAGSGAATRTLLAGAIDYAGLFPPAALSMEEAVRNYASYRNGPDAWALGRFVVPSVRLGDFRAALDPLLQAGGLPWRLSVLAGPGGATEWPLAQALGESAVVVEAAEFRAGGANDIQATAALLPRHIDVFFEIPTDRDPSPLIAAIAAAGAKAKVRTGGVTPDAFPTPGDLARFIVTCARARVPFKATAGLHHPLRAVRRLTYEADSARGEMFGFLNVLLAAAFAREGLSEEGVAALLVEGDAAAFRVEAAGIEWRARQVGTDALRATRRELALSFGSCSFREPIEELEGLGLL